MNKVVMLIVVYNKMIEDSETVNTLFSSGIKGIKVVIHNNGPQEIFISDVLKDKFSTLNWEVSLINCIVNQPLSILYNEFILANPGYDTYSLLDDDTKISHDFVQALIFGESDVELPKIISKIDAKQYYPLVGKKVFEGEGIIVGDNVFSIGSGLTFSQSLIKTFEKHNLSLFDENFALYGVDFSFFRRLILLKSKGEKFEITSNSKLLHSLSKVESIQSTFRRQERLIDFVLTVRHYPTFRLYLSLIKRMLTEIRFKRGDDLKIMIKTFLSGKHVRCKTWMKNKDS